MMMKMKHVLWAVSILLITACGSVSDPDAAVDQLATKAKIADAQVDSIEAVLRKFPNETQLSVGFIEDSSTVFYGALRRDDTLRTIDNANKVFEIGSLTKVFTSALLANFAIDGYLQLDHPIWKYLDFPLKDSLNITFRQLANHTSGLPRIPEGFVRESFWHMDNPYKDYDEEKLKEYLKADITLLTDPGTTYRYSNIGAGILGYILTQIKEKSFEHLLREYIFQPMNMRASTTDREIVKDRLVKGLSKRGKPAANWDLASLKGAGAVLSSAEDLAKYGIAYFEPSNEALTLQRQTTFTVNDSMDVALGWFILNRDTGDRWYWHNGGTGGYRSSMVLDMDNRKGVIVLSNISSGHKHAEEIDQLSKDLLANMR